MRFIRWLRGGGRFRIDADKDAMAEPCASPALVVAMDTVDGSDTGFLQPETMETEFIISRTVDSTGWILSDPKGNVMILWEHRQFAQTWRIEVSNQPRSFQDRVELGMVLRRMAEWLALHRPELLMADR